MKVNGVRGRGPLYWLFRGAAVVLGVFVGAPLLAQDHWYAQLHVGRHSPESLENMLSHNWRLQNEYLASLGVGRELIFGGVGWDWNGKGSSQRTGATAAAMVNLLRRSMLAG